MDALHKELAQQLREFDQQVKGGSMSNTQPEALRLAEKFELRPTAIGAEAAAELRRLHALNAELLEALKGLVMFPLGTFQVEAARAAIAKAEGQQ